MAVTIDRTFIRGDFAMTSRKLLDGDVISGAVLAALGAYICLQASRWTYSGPDGPGPAFFPIWYGICIIGLSLALIARRLFIARAGEARVDWSSAGRALGTWAAFVLTIVLMRPLGFVVSIGLLTFFLVLVVFRQSLLAAALTAVCSALAFKLVFSLALGVELPPGPFGVF
jgi:putative tricarboxylic transport membrane protein